MAGKKGIITIDFNISNIIYIIEAIMIFVIGRSNKKQILLGFSYTILSLLARVASSLVVVFPSCMKVNNSPCSQLSNSILLCSRITDNNDGHDNNDNEQNVNKNFNDAKTYSLKDDSMLHSHRRKMILNLLPSSIATISLISSIQRAVWAIDEGNDEQQKIGNNFPSNNNNNRPFTPTIEPLIPTIYIYMQLLAIRKLVDEWNSSKAVNDNPEDSYSIINQIKRYFEEPSLNIDPRPLSTTSSQMRKRYNRERQMIESKFITRKTLESGNKKNDDSNIIIPLSGKFARSACNVYTANLRFSDTYILTADPIIRKSMIRNDLLPDIKTVITSDLDLRDLYRNELQTSIDDIQAELYNKNNNPDPMEVQELLYTAIDAIENWLNLIRPQDIILAQDILQKEILPQLSSSITTTDDKRNEVKLLLKLPDPYQH